MMHNNYKKFKSKYNSFIVNNLAYFIGFNATDNRHPPLELIKSCNLSQNLIFKAIHLLAEALDFQLVRVYAVSY